MMMMMIDPNPDNDDDSDRTETYTPPPLDITNDLNSSSEKENHYKDSSVNKQQSIIVLDDSSDQITNTEPIDSEPTIADNYWDQWPLVNNEINDEEHVKLYSIPDIDIPPSPPPPPPRQSIPSSTADSNILDILTLPSCLPQFNRTNHSPAKKPVIKRKKKKKKPMSDYRPPSPFSPKPDYKSMDIEQIKKHAMRYGLSTTQAKGRLIKILDEIYNVTHQYETDTDYEFETTVMDIDRPEKKDLLRTPPTPAIIQDAKKVKKRPAIHQMSSSDDNDEQLAPPPPPPLSVTKKPTPTATFDNDNDDQSEDNDTDHEGRFLELTIHELSSTASSSSSPTPPITDLKISSQSNPTNKKPPKKPKLETPTMPLKDIVRNYIESNPTLHSRILFYEPIDFEEFHKQMKTDLNLKIASKELMRCLDDQCITFTLRSRKGAFTSVMRAKRRHK